ncbi:MAG: hypothetical protein ACK4S4_00460 [Pyrinomonadaceae bacterium]
MRPDQRWFPTSRTERAAWFQNFANEFARVAIDLGFTQADIDAVNADNDVIQYLQRQLISVKAYLTALQTFDREITHGKRSDAVRPVPELPPMPVPAVATAGIFERLERLVRRIRTMPKYTHATGALLGIIPRKPDAAAMLPERPKNFVAKPLPAGYGFKVSVSRLGYPSFIIEIRRQGEAEWTYLATCVGTNSIRCSVEPLAPGKPELIHVRTRMCKGNDPVGQYSDAQVLTLTP